MAKIQLGKFKANGQEYQKLQINRTLGPSIGDQAYLGRFSSHDGNHSLALSIHDVIADTIAQYKIFSSLNVANGVWSEVEPTSKLDKQDIVVSTRTDGPVISIRVTRITKALGFKEYQVKCLNLRPVMETYLREVEVGFDGEYGQGYITPRPMPQVQLDPRSHIPPVPPMVPAPGKPMPANGIDTAVLFKMLMDHMAAPAPHVSHEIIARKNRPFGYAGLDGRGMLPARSIPAKAKLTIRIGNEVVVYDGTTDVDLSFTNSGLIEDLGVSVAASLNSNSAATDADIAGLFDDDPTTPSLAPDDPGLIIDDDTVINNGSQSQGGSQSTGNQSTSSHQCANGCYCSGGTNEECQCGDGCCTTSTSGNEQTPAEQQPAEQTPDNHSCQCSCSSAGQQQSQQPQYGGYPYGYPQQYMVPPMYGIHFPPPPPPPFPPFPPFPPNQSQQPPQNSSGCNCNCNCNNGGNTNPNPNPAPEPELYSLTLNKNVADSGAVEGSGEYAANTSVSITATPSEGYVFVKWSDENTSPSRTIVMPAADTEYTAYFGYTLTVSSNDDNMGTASGSGNFLPNEVTTIEAHPSEGYHFLRWSDLGSDNNVRSVTVSNNLDIIAYFGEDIRQYTVTLTRNNDNYGEVTGAGVYNEGEDVTITATPNSGYKFVKWSDDVEDAERTFEDIHEDITLEAEFQKLGMRSITAAIKPSASYGRVEGTGDYERGTVITLTAIANPGYKFVKWMTGDDLAYSRIYTDNPLEYTVTSSTEFRAYFEVDNSSPKYTLSLHTNDESLGTVEGAGEYPEGAEVSIAANPIGDNVFVRWNDDNTENPRTVTMPGEDTWYVAYFGDTSSGEITEVEGEHPEDTKIIQAFPAEGYHFVRWNDGNQENPRVVSVDTANSFTAVFEPDVRNITVSVTVNNSEWGSVTDVEETYPLHTHIQLLATPKYGYRFVKWSDDIEDNPRTVVIEEDVSLQAYFTEQFYNLDITVNDDSMGTALFSESGPYREGTTVQVTANALAGYHFVRWDDYLEDITRSFTMDRDISHQIIFAQNSPTLTLTVNDSTMGYVTQSGDGTYEPGSTAIISAIAYDGYEFVKWSDENTSPSRSEVMDSSKTLEAIFDILMYTVNVTVPSSNVNMVTLSGAGDYLPGSKAVISVTVLPGNKIIFQKWNDGNTDNPREITVTEDVTYQATFSNARKLTLSSNDESKGTVSVEPESANGDGIYPYNTNVTLVAAPAERCRFVRWDGLESSNTSIRRSLNMYQDFSIQGIFDWNYLPLNVRAYDTTGYTTVTPIETYLTPATGSNYLEGDTASLSATPADDFHRFLRWDDNNTENPREITVSADKLSYIAYFEPDQFSLNVTSNNPAWGSVTISPDPNEETGKYDRNAQITLEAVPKSGAGTTFVEWSDNHSTKAKRTLNILEDTTFQAIFARDSYTLTVSATSSGHGSAAVVYNGETYPGGGTFVGDSVVQLIAIPDEGYEFTYWSDNTNNSDNPRNYLVTETKSIFASFTGVQRTVTLTCNDASRGYTMINNSKSTGGTFANGTTLTIKAVPLTGYVFDHWSDGVRTAERPSQAITSNITLQAIFGKASYSLTLNSSDAAKGSVSINGGEPDTTVTGTFQHGTPIRITAIAKEGYEFSKWSNNSTIADILDYSMPKANTNLTATFSIKKYNITVQSNDTNIGTAKASVYTSISHGSAVTLTATPKANCHFVSWNGTEQSNPWVVAITSAETFTAYFAKDIHSVTAISDNESRGTVSGSSSAEIGSVITITATPKNGYHFVGWNDSVTSLSRNITVTTVDQVFTAYFAPTQIQGQSNQLIITGVGSNGVRAYHRSSGESSYTQYDLGNPPVLETGKACSVLAAHETDDVITNGGDYNTFVISVTPNGEPIYVDNPVVLTELPGTDNFSADGIKVSAKNDTENIFPTLFSSETSSARYIHMVAGDDTLIITTQRKLRIKQYAFITSGSNGAKFDIYGSNNGEDWNLISAYNVTSNATGTSTTYYRYGGAAHAICVATIPVLYGGYKYHKFVYRQTGSYGQLYGFWLHQAYWVD